MNTSSSKNWEIEARLERSLRNQIRTPKLDGRFEAAVWAQIESAKASATAPAMPAKSAASRWLFAINVAGALVAVALVVMFGSQAFTGVEVNVTLLQVSQGFVERAVAAMIWPVTILALGFGMMFTSVGRRLRAEFF
jgi:hypothetical protein